MIGPKAQLHDLISEVGMKSNGEDLDDIDLSNRITSASVIGVNSVSGGP